MAKLAPPVQVLPQWNGQKTREWRERHGCPLPKRSRALRAAQYLEAGDEGKIHHRRDFSRCGPGTVRRVAPYVRRVALRRAPTRLASQALVGAPSICPGLLPQSDERLPPSCRVASTQSVEQIPSSVERARLQLRSDRLQRNTTAFPGKAFSTTCRGCLVSPERCTSVPAAAPAAHTPHSWPGGFNNRGPDDGPRSGSGSS